jgi:hypothetical protein
MPCFWHQEHWASHGTNAFFALVTGCQLRMKKTRAEFDAGFVV